MLESTFIQETHRVIGERHKKDASHPYTTINVHNTVEILASASAPMLYFYIGVG